jgi:hypothetical protein
MTYIHRDSLAATQMAHRVPTTFGDRARQFLRSAEAFGDLPAGVLTTRPLDGDSLDHVASFFSRFYNDNRKRVLVFGINPGRQGSGKTGIPFTDSFSLREFCGIPTEGQGGKEPTSQFVYEVIRRMGGPELFYADFFLTSVFPVCLTKNGKNFNYYDDPSLLKYLKPHLPKYIESQIALGATTELAVVIGSGKNRDVFAELNSRGQYFRKFAVLPHPRYVLQYKFEEKELFIREYIDVLEDARCVLDTHGEIGQSGL